MRALKAIGLWAILVAGLTSAAKAEIPDEVFRALDVSTRSELRGGMASIQSDLAWIGLYSDKISGRSNQATSNAIRVFQTSVGGGPSGTLSDDQRAILRRRALDTREGYEFRNEMIEWLGISLTLPMGILGTPSLGGKNFQFVNYDASHTSRLRLEFFGDDVNVSARAMLDATLKGLKESDPETEVLAQGTTSKSAYGAFRHYGYRHLLYAERSGAQWRKIEVRYVDAEHGVVRPIISRILHSVDLFAGAGVPKRDHSNRFRDRRYPGSDSTPAWYRTMKGNGSGSLVSRQGHILTNHHVVSTCARLTVNGRPAILLGTDSRLDLALIQSSDFSNRTPVRFRDDNPKLSERVAVMGYPVFQVSRSLNFTSGLVSSAVGYQGDRTGVQVTAPIQPGNSGGPVLDTNGTQIAVVAAKASVALQENKNVENIGWVIRGRQAIGFLERYGVRPIIETREPPEFFPRPSVISGWRQFTLRVECHFR